MVINQLKPASFPEFRICSLEIGNSVLSPPVKITSTWTSADGAHPGWPSFPCPGGQNIRLRIDPRWNQRKPETDRKQSIYNSCVNDDCQYEWNPRVTNLLTFPDIHYSLFPTYPNVPYDKDDCNGPLPTYPTDQKVSDTSVDMISDNITWR